MPEPWIVLGYAAAPGPTAHEQCCRSLSLAKILQMMSLHIELMQCSTRCGSGVRDTPLLFGSGDSAGGHECTGLASGVCFQLLSQAHGDE